MTWFRALRILLIFGVSGKFLFWIRGCLDRGAAIDRPTLIDLSACVVMLSFLLALEVGEEARKRDGAALPPGDEGDEATIADRADEKS